MNVNNISPELQIIFNQRLRASEGQNGGHQKRRGPMLRGQVKLPTGSLPSRGLASRKSHDGDMVCSPPNRSPQGGSTWPARREHPTRDPISSAPDQQRPPLLNQRARTLNNSAMNAVLNSMDWKNNKASYWDSQTSEDVVKDLSSKLRQTQQGNKEAYAQNRQLREECRQYGEWNNNLMDTQKNLMDNQRLVQQECAEFAILNKRLMESQERLQEECGDYEMHTHRLENELSDYEAQNHNLKEAHNQECRDFMAHERDLMASQARLMDDYKVKEAENDILKYAQQRLSGEYKEQVEQNSSLVEVKDRLSDEYKEQLKQNSFLADVKDRLHVECVAYKAKLAEALLTNEKEGAPEQDSTQSEPDPEADMEGEPDEAEQQQVDVERLPEQGSPQSDACSEGRLRRVLTSHTSTTEELRQALASVEALMSEARRELANRELRERRAGYEQLHNATEGRDESALEEAIAVACKVGVDADDIEKAEAKLELLRSISDEERTAQEAQRELAERKRRSFQLVKQGKALALKELLGDSHDAGSKSWLQWKDHSGRSLLSYAKELRVATVQECLEHMMSNDIEADSMESGSQQEEHTPEQEISEEVPATVLTSQPPVLATEDVPDECSPQHVTRVTTPSLARWSPESEPDTVRVVTKCDCEWPATPAKLVESLKEAGGNLAAEEQEALRLQAFKAVVKDDTVTLADILAKVPSDVWSSWQNKAAKDLLTLAQERRSPASYSMMAKELGILQERKRESFEERETVWVLFPGEVQARHATVLEDTSADATEVLLEFWDDDGPPSKVDHALVMKTA